VVVYAIMKAVKKHTLNMLYDIFASEKKDLIIDLVHDNGGILQVIQIIFNTINIPFKFQICHNFLPPLISIGLF
jgi:hypothetical protein